MSLLKEPVHTLRVASRLDMLAKPGSAGYTLNFEVTNSKIA